MSNDPFAAPSKGAHFDKPAKARNLNALMAFEVLGLEKDVQTDYGTSDAIKANVYVLDGEGKGEEYTNTLLFGGMVIPQLQPRIGQLVLGRWTQGTPKKASQDPPWIIAEPTDDDRKVGIAWHEARTKPADPFADANAA